MTWERLDQWTEVMHMGGTIYVRTLRISLDRANDDVSDFLGEHCTIRWDAIVPGNPMRYGRVVED